MNIFKENVADLISHLISRCQESPQPRSDLKFVLCVFLMRRCV